MPLKPTPIGGYTKPHTNKILKKIIKISKLKSKASKTGKAEDKKRYKINRNVVSKLHKKLRKVYLNFRKEEMWRRTKDEVSTKNVKFVISSITTLSM